MTTQITPWDRAEQHCLSTIRAATEMAELIKTINALDVGEVMPLISTLMPTLSIIPEKNNSKEEIKTLTLEIQELTGALTAKTVQAGDYWKVSIRAGTITIDIITTIPHARPDSFDL